MMGNLSSFPAAKNIFLKKYQGQQAKSPGPHKGPQKFKYKECEFFDLKMKNVCFQHVTILKINL